MASSLRSRHLTCGYLQCRRNPPRGCHLCVANRFSQGPSEACIYTRDISSKT
ncbi:DUF6485 family protein [Rhodopseudomonas pseudopalustris]|uniref:DUF6485 family protein n=1 Tax=Rhodopseudomonas pseudopalustris TaxID=1513892 RepID=UPI003F957D40